jgi:hypothetical protein
MTQDFSWLRERKWVVLQASALGFVVFQLLAMCAGVVASEIDRIVYTSVTAAAREVLVRHRAWELYRALLYCTAAAFAGWIVAFVYRSHRTHALAAVVVVLGASLLVSLFTGPGYYLRDLVLIASITISPVIGAVWLPQLAKRVSTQLCGLDR